jgi:hypothetical protein
VIDAQKLGKAGQIEIFRNNTGRLIGMFIPGDFKDYASFPPFLTTEAERKHLAEGYKVSSAEREAQTKAHVTDDDLPLQIVILNRDAGAYVRPHFHNNDQPAKSETRHQLMVCQRGSLRIGLYSKEGERVGHVVLHEHDMVLMCEGHSLEWMADDTKTVEIKMGPFPGNDADDKIDLDIDREPYAW